MGNRAWGGAIRRVREDHPGATRNAPRGLRPLQFESLEDRQLLAAALAPIGSVSVPASLGSAVPLDGSAANNTRQTFTVMSSNPDIKATVATGKFLTFNVTHTASPSVSGDISFSGAITFQFFGNLTPVTASNIEAYTNAGLYNSGQFFRVANNIPPGSNGFIIQGGTSLDATSGSTTVPSNLPPTPFIDEFNPQLAFTGTYQLAMANGGPDTNSTQFFITTGQPQNLDFHHTIFAQLVAGQDIVRMMTQVITQNATLPGLTNEKSLPVSPIQITNATITNTNPNGVVLIDATGAQPNESSTITVTATDPSTSTTETQTFPVTTTAVPTPATRPYVNPLPGSTVVQTSPTLSQSTVYFQQNVGLNQPDVFRIPAVVTSPGDQITYTVQGGLQSATTFAPVSTNATATVDQNTGIVTVTPRAGFSGTINLLVGVRDQVNRGSQTSSTTSLDTDPSNFEYHQILLNVSQNSTPVPLAPIAVPITQTVTASKSTTIQLQGNGANPQNPIPPTLTFQLLTPPTKGTITNFNAQTGSLTYTANPNTNGTDTFQYQFTNTSASANQTSQPATVTLNISTGAVRVIGNVLVVTPVPRTDGGTNTINVTQINDPTNAANDELLITVNGTIDPIQPLVFNTEGGLNINRIVVFGSKANDTVTIEPSVDPAIFVTLDGGHGGGNNLRAAVDAAGGSTREHGWFGFNNLFGGTGPNQLIGRKGHVAFHPTASTVEIFAGVIPPPSKSFFHHNAPGGTFFKNVNGRAVPITKPDPGASAVRQALTPTQRTKSTKLKSLATPSAAHKTTSTPVASSPTKTVTIHTSGGTTKAAGSGGTPPTK